MDTHHLNGQLAGLFNAIEDSVHPLPRDPESALEALFSNPRDPISSKENSATPPKRTQEPQANSSSEKEQSSSMLQWTNLPSPPVLGLDLAPRGKRWAVTILGVFLLLLIIGGGIAWMLGPLQWTDPPLVIAMDLTPSPTWTPTVRPTNTAPPRPTPIPVTPTAPKPTSTPPEEPVLPVGIPTLLQIPAIDLEALITPVSPIIMVVGGQQVSSWDVPNSAVGWHNTSAPLGQNGNTVLNGHQSIQGGVFGSLGQLELGDQVIVYSDDVAHAYTITEKHYLSEEDQPLEVRFQNAAWIEPTQDTRLTLITCAPSNNTHRLILIARPSR